MRPRFHDWPTRLQAEVRRREGQAFRWGRHDCCLAAVACVQAMTGQDLAEGLRGYGNKTGAQDLIDQAGGLEPLLASVALRHGLEEVTWHFAQRGDLAMVGTPQGPSLGIVWLCGTKVLKAVRVGWQEVPLRKAMRAWRVG